MSLSSGPEKDFWRGSHHEQGEVVWCRLLCAANMQHMVWVSAGVSSGLKAAVCNGTAKRHSYVCSFVMAAMSSYRRRLQKSACQREAIALE